MIDMSSSKLRSEAGSSNFFLYLLATFITILVLLVFLKVGSIQDELRYISSETVKVRNTRLALSNMACISCHGADNPSQMLPLRALNPSAFRNYLRGERVGLGYSACPPYSRESLSDSDLSKIYAILYGGSK